MNTLVRFEASLVPLSLVVDPPMSDDEFERFCAGNQDVQIERSSEGVIRVNPPTGGLTGNGNSEINRQLGNWWDSHRRGRVFDSSTGFFLADGSLMSPDAAYVSQEQLKGFAKAQLARMPHLCPVFVIELLSETESLSRTQTKMELWIANGAELGWLVDPYRQCVEVYQPGSAAVTLDGPLMQGAGTVDGFVLDLTKVWRCYEV
jgi:Uma2 family endonuclease